MTSIGERNESDIFIKRAPIILTCISQANGTCCHRSLLATVHIHPFAVMEFTNAPLQTRDVQEITKSMQL
jgi:hypothetical protein